MLKNRDVLVPAGITGSSKKTYIKNYLTATHNTGRILLFAGDQKVEHLNKDFYGSGISVEDSNPKHLFEIASKSNIGVFAAHLGMISRYGQEYNKVNYLVKMNGKSNLPQGEPVSKAWHNISEIVDFRKKSKLNILGVGYTIYIGSEHENEMMIEAAKIIREAHDNGLLVVLWMYPRGKAIEDQLSPDLIAGVTGIGCSLGADFVKVNYPAKEGEESREIFKQAIKAAGNVGVVCAGGSPKDEKEFLEVLYDQIHTSGAMGAATGRNIHQKDLDEAVSLVKAMSDIIYDGKTVNSALENLKLFSNQDKEEVKVEESKETEVKKDEKAFEVPDYSDVESKSPEELSKEIDEVVKEESTKSEDSKDEKEEKEKDVKDLI